MYAKLPDLPKDKEFEECVSAFFQADGAYIERNIDDRSTLELDIIASNYSNGSFSSTLIEAKSGKWGLKDVFKVKGWMEYLGFKKGAFVVSEEHRPISNSKKVGEKLDIHISLLKDIKNPETCLNELIDSHNIDKRDVTIWRFSYWLERNLIDLLKNKKKEISCQRYIAMLDYYDQINNGAFFSPNTVSSTDLLYKAYEKYPNLSAKCSHEIVGDSFESEYSTIPKNLFDETFYQPIFNDIHISAYLEHKARLSILTNLINYKLYELNNMHDKAGGKLYFAFGDEKAKIDLVSILPQSFKNGLDEISTHKYFYRYPVFWQWFLWAFGGFYLPDLKEKEYLLMSSKTGIPVEYIDEALDVYNILFPLENRNWFFSWYNSNITSLLIFPLPFAGIGANMRRLYYANDSKFEKVKNLLGGQYTFSDLLKWNKMLIEVLNINKN